MNEYHAGRHDGGGSSWAIHGYSPIYRDGELNHCPGCGWSCWFIGRSTAECAHCGCALPLQHTGLEGCSLGGIYWDRDVLRHGSHYGSNHHVPSPSDAAEWAA